MRRFLYAVLFLLPLPVRADRLVEKIFFGMHVQKAANIATVPVDFGTIGPMPGTGWKWLEPEAGKWNWGAYDSYIAAARARGCEIIFTFLRTPSWAAPAQNLPPSDLNSSESCAPPATGSGDCAYKTFVTALVSRYKGKINYYQLWNEPNSSGYWNGSVEDLVHMSRDAAEIIHRLDPAAKVMTPVTSPSGYPRPHDQWLAEFLDKGGSQFCDIGSWHGYLQATTFKAPWPERAQSETPGCTVGTWRCPGSVLDSYQAVRNVMDAHGMSGKELWDTEGGWGVNDTKHADLADANEQAAWLARWYIVQAGAGVPRAVWYMWDAKDGWGTLWDGQLKPAGRAFQEVYGWLVGNTISPCRQEGDIWSCAVTRPGGQPARIVWSSNGNPEYRVPNGFKTVRDLSGNRRAADSSIRLTPAPILIE